MDNTSILKIVGQVAGIGGLALGVLLLIFKEVIRKNIFPNLSQIQAFKIIKLIVILTFSISSLGIGAWVYIQIHKNSMEEVVFPGQSAEPVILNHLRLVDENKLSEAWDSLSNEAHRRFQFDFIRKAYESDRTPLGKVLERKLAGINAMRELPDHSQGAFATAMYVSKFEHGGSYSEYVTTIAENGEWKVLFHQILPCSPPICKS